TRSYGDWSSDVCSSDLAQHFISRDLLPFALLKLAADTLGLIDGDEAVLDEQIGKRALIRIGRLLLLFAAEFDLGAGGEPHIDDRSEERRVGKERAGECG